MVEWCLALIVMMRTMTVQEDDRLVRAARASP